MAQQKIQNLYNLAPQFKNERDDVWYQYLPAADSSYLRFQRNAFHIANDKIDQRKQELKEHSVGSNRHNDIKSELMTLKRELDTILNELLRKIPILKAKAQRAQQSRVDPTPNPSQSYGFGVPESDYLSNFLPSHLSQPKPKPKPSPKPQEAPRKASPNPPGSGASAAKAQAEPAYDQYLVGVWDEDIEIMNKMRVLADKFDCRDKILAALRSIRERDFYLDKLQDIKKRASKAPSEKASASK